ncbi:hypothetical protein ES705_25837 [subsurface metagenome]
MKKIYLSLLFILGFVFFINAQSWMVYDGSVLPSETGGGGDTIDFTNVSDNSPGAGMIQEVLQDHEIPGNKLFKYFHPDGKTTFRHDFNATYADSAFTIVARLRGCGDLVSFDRVMDVRWDNGNAETRNELRIYYEGRVKLEKTGLSVNIDFDVNDWHIYRIQVIGDSAAVFVDESSEHLIAGSTTSSSTSQSLRFGDGSGDAIGGFVDWIVLDTTGGYTPAEMPLPSYLTGLGDDETVVWSVYDADVLPDASEFGMTPSNVAGTDQHTNTIIADPDSAGNNLLELISPEADPGKFMWKYNLPSDVGDSITLVARVKGASDTLDRTMEFDFQQAGFRERLYIKNDTTYELKESGVKDSLPGDPQEWHIYRMTKDADTLIFYLDEDPVPIAEVITTTPTTENYFRFGDGNGSSTLGALVDWISWTTSGIYAPGEVGLPPTDPKSPDATLSSLTPDLGTLVPDFHPDSISYSLELPLGSTSVTFTVTPNYPLAQVSGDGEFTGIPGTAVIAVTAETGHIIRYSVEVSIALSEDASLSGLTVSEGELDPPFDPEITSYALEVPSGTTSVTLTATANDPDATVDGDGEITGLPTTATITVSAPAGNTLDYTVDITLAPIALIDHLSEAIAIYPNPASEVVTIELAGGASNIAIYNVSGALIETIETKDNIVKLDVSAYDPGMYFIKISGNNLSAISKLIIE